MKVCIIGPSSPRYMPFVSCYEEVLQSQDTKYDIIGWDRHLLGETGNTLVMYSRDGTASGWRVIPGYLGYRKFVLRWLAENEYDFYIVLTAQVGIALLDFLASRRFILDIRDFSHEDMLPYRIALSVLMKKSLVVAISSPGFKNWLPTSKNIILSHNTTISALHVSSLPFDFGSKRLLNIGGMIYYQEDLDFINCASKLNGWEIEYVGKGVYERQLEQYCRDNALPVTFRGAFGPEEKISHYRRANFVISHYGNRTQNTRTLLPNRLYESCVLGRPIIVCEGTYLGETVRGERIGVATSLKSVSEMSRQLNWYYVPSNYDEYLSHCRLFLEKVEKDVIHFQEIVGSLLESC
jgi:hypothetical protein